MLVSSGYTLKLHCIESNRVAVPFLQSFSLSVFEANHLIRHICVVRGSISHGPVCLSTEGLTRAAVTLLVAPVM